MRHICLRALHRQAQTGDETSLRAGCLQTGGRVIMFGHLPVFDRNSGKVLFLLAISNKLCFD